MVVLHVAALERIQKMGDRGVFRRDGHLHAALGHHAVGVSQPELRRQDHLGAGFVCVQRRRATGSAAADHQHVRLMMGNQVDAIVDRAVPLEQRRQLDDRFFSFIRTKAKGTIGTGPVIGMVLMNQLIAVGRRQSRERLFSSGIAGLVDDLLQCVNVHASCSPTVIRISSS